MDCVSGHAHTQTQRFDRGLSSLSKWHQAGRHARCHTTFNDKLKRANYLLLIISSVFSSSLTPRLFIAVDFCKSIIRQWRRDALELCPSKAMGIWFDFNCHVHGAWQWRMWLMGWKTVRPFLDMNYTNQFANNNNNNPIASLLIVLLVVSL